MCTDRMTDTGKLSPDQYCVSYQFFLSMRISLLILMKLFRNVINLQKILFLLFFFSIYQLWLIMDNSLHQIVIVVIG